VDNLRVACIMWGGMRGREDIPVMVTPGEMLGGGVVMGRVLGCNNGSGGGNFSKVKRLVSEWIGTRKRLFSGFLTHGCDFRNARTFSRGIFHS